jgi:hypothetical protein
VQSTWLLLVVPVALIRTTMVVEAELAVLELDL